VVAAGETFREFIVPVQKHFMACCRYREAVKLFRFLLSSYTFIMLCGKCRTALFVKLRRFGSLKLMYLFYRIAVSQKFEYPYFEVKRLS
jgi:hypothetical protein